MAGDRTEQASPQRRDKAKREGDILHSRELTSAAATLAGVVLLGWIAPMFVDRWRSVFGAVMAYGSNAAWETGAVDTTLTSLRGLILLGLAPAGMVSGGVAMAALAAGVMQTGGVQLHWSAVSFKPDRINPLTGIKNLFSLRALGRLGKSLIPAAALAALAVQRLSRQWDIPPFSSKRMLILGGEVYEILLASSMLMFGWAAVDFMIEWRSRESRLKMSREDQRQEYKESEGNPQIKQRIRSLRRQAKRRRLAADLTKAAVVITNPTHYAVALEFDFEAMDAPKVLAKGRNLQAQEIKDKARWAGVPILENPPLARSLYKLVDEGQAIPTDLYAAVASILAFLYRQRMQEEMRRRQHQSRRQQEARGASPVRPRDGAAASTAANSAAMIRSTPWRTDGGVGGGSVSSAREKTGGVGSSARTSGGDAKLGGDASEKARPAGAEPGTSRDGGDKGEMNSKREGNL